MSLMFNLMCVLPSGPKLARIEALKKSLPLHFQKFKAENVSIVIYFSTFVVILKPTLNNLNNAPDIA